MNDDMKVALTAGIDRALANGVRSSITDDVMTMEKLFVAWVDDPGASAAKLSEVTGIERSVILRVLRSGIMQKRYAEETEGFRAIAKPYTQSRVHAIMDQAIDRLTTIIEHGEDKDAIAAVRVLTNMVKEPADGVSTLVVQDNRVLSIASEGLSSLDQVKRLVEASVSGNIQEVEAQRAKRG